MVRRMPAKSCSTPAASETPLQLSIVMPCLDESETLETCIEKARRFLEESGLRGEIVVADNGSRDGSPEIARRAGARVVPVETRGYGSALRGGIEAARGEYVVLGDADDSYDFRSLEPFVEQLRQGHDLVVGNRFRGGIRPGAMSRLHRWGNRILTGTGHVLFGVPIGDFHCGLRALRRSAYPQMGLRTTGMEFASEMVIKSALQGLRVTEVPTVLRPDGRSRPPHLRTWRDGWRHLRFMLMFSPRWLFLYPGLLLFLLGAAASALLALGSVRMGSVVFDVHTLAVSGLMCLLGYQLIAFAVFTKVFAVTEGFHPTPAYFGTLFRYARLETGLLAGVMAALLGLTLLLRAVWSWWDVGLGGLDPAVTMRQVVPAVVLLALGVETVAASFFLSILGLGRR